MRAIHRLVLFGGASLREGDGESVGVWATNVWLLSYVHGPNQCFEILIQSK